MQIKENHVHHAPPQTETVRDPVCGMDITPGDAAGGSAEHGGHTYWFCNPGCRAKFVANPAKYLTVAAPVPSPVAADKRIFTCPMHPEVRQTGPGSCPKCGMALEPVTVSLDDDSNPELLDMNRRFLTEPP